MMSKDRPRAVLAVLVALSFVAGAGSAGATDASVVVSLGAVSVGVGIDHTMRTHVLAAQGQVGAIDAIDRLNRPIAQPLPTRQPAQDAARTPISGLRGLLDQGGLDSALSALPSGRSGEPATASRRASRAAPYVRFSDDEQVFGFSFKIQPPPQAPEVSAPRS